MARKAFAAVGGVAAVLRVLWLSGATARGPIKHRNFDPNALHQVCVVRVRPLGGHDWRGRLVRPTGEADWCGRLVRPTVGTGGRGRSSTVRPVKVIPVKGDALRSTI